MPIGAAAIAVATRSFAIDIGGLKGLSVYIWETQRCDGTGQARGHRSAVPFPALRDRDGCVFRLSSPDCAPNLRADGPARRTDVSAKCGTGAGSRHLLQAYPTRGRQWRGAAWRLSGG